jgi:predicted peroxiredoxin
MNRIKYAATATVLMGFVLGCTNQTTTKLPATTDKPTIVLNITSGKEDLHAVAMALHLAGHSLADGRTTVLFFNVHAPAIAAKELADDVKFGDGLPIRQQVEELLKKGAKAYVCPFCVQSLGLKPDDFIPGIEMATRESLFSHLHTNTTVFTY